MSRQAILVVDIGNTNIVVGYFDGGMCRRFWRLAADSRRTDDEYAVMLHQLLAQAGFDKKAITGVVIGSVVPALSGTLDSAFIKTFGTNPFHITHQAKLQIKNTYTNPREVGIDRLANATGGVRSYGAPLIVVDLGTAVTLDVVSRKLEYLGGAILPGIELSAEALSKRTARLPLASTAAPESPIGRTTVESIRSGILLGLVGSVDYLIASFWKELGYKTATIATGGLAPLLIGKSRYVRKVDAELTLRGLLEIYKLNAKRMTPSDTFAR